MGLCLGATGRSSSRGARAACLPVASARPLRRFDAYIPESLEPSDISDADLVVCGLKLPDQNGLASVALRCLGQAPNVCSKQELTFHPSLLNGRMVSLLAVPAVPRGDNTQLNERRKSGRRKGAGSGDFWVPSPSSLSGTGAEAERGCLRSSGAIKAESCSTNCEGDRWALPHAAMPHLNGARV